jgi:hypothetical protein
MGTHALMRIVNMETLGNPSSIDGRALWGHLETEPEKNVLLFKHFDGHPKAVLNDIERASKLANKLDFGSLLDPEIVAGLLISSSMRVMPLSINWRPLMTEKDVWWEYAYFLNLNSDPPEWRLNYWGIWEPEYVFKEWKLKPTRSPEHIPQDIFHLRVYDVLDKYVYSKMSKPSP